MTESSIEITADNIVQSINDFTPEQCTNYAHKITLSLTKAASALQDQQHFFEACSDLILGSEKSWTEIPLTEFKDLILKNIKDGIIAQADKDVE